MKSSAIVLSTALLSVSLLRPPAALAQTVTTAELLGTWTAVPGEDPLLKGDTTLVQVTLTLRADSIFERTNTYKDGRTNLGKGYWRVDGDTIRWGEPPNWGAPAPTPPGDKVTLQNQRLSILSRFIPNGEKLRQVYQRAAAPQKP